MVLDGQLTSKFEKELARIRLTTSGKHERLRGRKIQTTVQKKQQVQGLCVFTGTKPLGRSDDDLTPDANKTRSSS